MNILEVLGKKILFFDGGMGTLIQEKGATPGENTDIWNITRPEDIMDIHRKYLEAGANIILANTFGSNRLKLAKTGYTVDEVIGKGIANAKAVATQAIAEGFADPELTFVALDMAPTGKLLKPLGDLSFDDAYEIFKEVAIAGEKAGADFAHIETMSDTYELKAAILAVKENTNLPVFSTVTFDMKGKLLTGADVEAVVALLEGLGVNALGANCGLGPIQLRPMIMELLEKASVPVIINPNAGLPRQENGKTVYDVGPEEFAEVMEEFARGGALLLGGCCGTTPAHIKALVQRCGQIQAKPLEPKMRTVVSSYTHGVEIGDSPIIIGERINPTGKSRFKQALRDKDLDYILEEGFAQQDKGAHILDVNVGLPEIDETEMIVHVTREIQSVIDLPLQIDTSNVEAMEQALRYYNGKAMINSVNGKKESMDAVFPLVKKYGGVVVGLTLDEGGIPETAKGRLAVAEKIVKTAESYGISRKDIVIDVLCMTISSDKNSAMITLDALKMVKEKLGVHTILGVSNISFGLPRRDIINANFYTMALMAGLDCGIINPNADGMMSTYYGYQALAGKDENCSSFIEAYAGTSAPVPGGSGGNGSAGSGGSGGTGNQGGSQGQKDGASAKSSPESQAMTLENAIERGMKDQARNTAAEMVRTMDPLVLINEHLIPALDKVGKGFEAGTVFLPQLLMSAEAAKSAFEPVKMAMDAVGKREKKGKIIVATVKGDIHDIGKNIVKVLLENYGFDVYDLGKDVPAEVIVEAALKDNVKLIGLSALMTTTVTSMEEAIAALHEKKPDCKVMVGGAVLTEQYADMISADYYAKDAMASVYFAQNVLQPESLES